MANQGVPSDRYGSRTTSRTPRRVYAVLVSLVVILGLAAAIIGYRNLGTQPIEAKHTAFTVHSDHEVRLTIEVQRDDPQRQAVCVVHARSEDGDEAGRRELYIPPARGTARYDTVVHTSKRPVLGEVFGCSYTVPPYLDPAQREQHGAAK